LGLGLITPSFRDVMDGNRKGDDGLLARIWVGLFGIEVMRLCLLVGPDLCSFGDGEDGGGGWGGWVYVVLLQ
jgi:hypothetical protein